MPAGLRRRRQVESQKRVSGDGIGLDGVERPVEEGAVDEVLPREEPRPELAGAADGLERECRYPGVVEVASASHRGGHRDVKRGQLRIPGGQESIGLGDRFVRREEGRHGKLKPAGRGGVERTIVIGTCLGPGNEVRKVLPQGRPECVERKAWAGGKGEGHPCSREDRECFQRD